MWKMLKIQMLEQIMNNENSDEDVEPSSQANSIDASASEAFQNGHVDFFVKKRSTKRWVLMSFFTYHKRLIVSFSFFLIENFSQKNILRLDSSHRIQFSIFFFVASKIQSSPIFIEQISFIITWSRDIEFVCLWLTNYLSQFNAAIYNRTRNSMF